MLSCVWLLVTPWTVICQAPLSIDYSGKNTGVVSLSLLHEIFPTQEATQDSCIAGRFLTVWAAREAKFTMSL